MAEAAKQHRGELAAWHAATVVSRIPFAGEPPDPAEINPYRVRKQLSEAQVRLAKWKKKRAWRAGLKELSKGKFRG